ncbi:MAG TPA: hypothetical protein VFZ44_10295, partial [Pyrinomonadaceae bacterium]
MEAEQKLRQLTEETDWEKLLPDLVEYARRRSQGGMRWRGAGGGAVPGGYEAEDFAHEALVQLLAEERNWNPEKETLKEFVKGVISSKVSHRAESRENSLERRATSVREEANAALVYVSEETAPAAETPDALLLEKEERALLLAS